MNFSMPPLLQVAASRRYPVVVEGQVVQPTGGTFWPWIAGRLLGNLEVGLGHVEGPTKAVFSWRDKAMDALNRTAEHFLARVNSLHGSDRMGQVLDTAACLTAVAIGVPIVPVVLITFFASINILGLTGVVYGVAKTVPDAAQAVYQANT